MTNYNDGQIHGWNGGDCPVHPETVVEYWMRRHGASECNAGGLLWGHSKSPGDIIAFRVVKPYVEPKVIWVNECADGEVAVFPSEAEAKKRTYSRPTRIAVKYVEVKE